MEAPHGIVHELGRLKLQNLVGHVDGRRGRGQTVEAGHLGAGAGVLEHHRGISLIDELGLGEPIPLDTAENGNGQKEPEPVGQQIADDVEGIDGKPLAG